MLDRVQFKEHPIKGTWWCGSYSPCTHNEGWGAATTLAKHQLKHNMYWLGPSPMLSPDVVPERDKGAGKRVHPNAYALVIVKRCVVDVPTDVTTLQQVNHLLWVTVQVGSNNIKFLKYVRPLS